MKHFIKFDENKSLIKPNDQYFDIMGLIAEIDDEYMQATWIPINGNIWYEDLLETGYRFASDFINFYCENTYVCFSQCTKDEAFDYLTKMKNQLKKD